MHCQDTQSDDSDTVPERGRGAAGRTVLMPLRAAATATAPVLALVVLYATAASGQTRSEAPDREGDVLVQLGIVLLLIVLGGAFAMAEAALLSARRSRIDQLVEEGDRRAGIVAKLLSNPTRMLSTLQVGVTLLGLFSAGAAAESAVGPLAQFLRGQFAETPVASSAHGIAFVIVLLGVSLLTLVVGEIAPKSIAVRHPEAIALAFGRPVRWFETLVIPIVSLVTWLSNVLTRPFGVTASFQTSAFSEDELKIMVEQSEEYGVIEPEQREMIHSIFDLGETRVSAVMTPRLDIAAVEADVSLDELIRKVTESGHSRLPVYDDDLDNIVGVVHAKDVLSAMADGPAGASVRGLAKAATFIPESKHIDALLAEFRRHKRQIAIVRDEYGTVTGIVTIEDILEEIVGEIQDEYDEEEAPIRQIDPQTASVDGRMSIADFNDRMGAELPEEDADTVGGFVFGLMGHQPAQGEVATWDGMEFRVEVTDGRRINRVCVVRTPPPAPSGENGADDGGAAETEEL